MRYASETSLYVNGVLDVKVAETTPGKSAAGPVYLGGAPAGVQLATEGADEACDRVHIMLDEVCMIPAHAGTGACERQRTHSIA